MLDRYSGKLLHIDFGDCFEASMHREKFPEKVCPYYISYTLKRIDDRVQGVGIPIGTEPLSQHSPAFTVIHR